MIGLTVSFLFSMTEGPANTPETVKITATGPTAERWSSIFGKYTKISETKNRRPIWKHSSGYLYYHGKNIQDASNTTFTFKFKIRNIRGPYCNC